MLVYNLVEKEGYGIELGRLRRSILCRFMIKSLDRILRVMKVCIRGLWGGRVCDLNLWLVVLWRMDLRMIKSIVGKLF